MTMTEQPPAPSVQVVAKKEPSRLGKNRCGFCRDGDRNGAGRHPHCPGAVRNGDGTIIICPCQCRGPRCLSCSLDAKETVIDPRLWVCMDSAACEMRQLERRRQVAAQYARFRPNRQETAMPHVIRDANLAPIARKKGVECHCGCGGTTKGGRFQPGHDAKLKGALARIVARPEIETAQRIFARAEQIARGPAWAKGTEAIDAAAQALLEKEGTDALLQYAVRRRNTQAKLLAGEPLTEVQPDLTTTPTTPNQALTAEEIRDRADTDGITQ